MVHPTLEVLYGLKTHELDAIPPTTWGDYLRATGRKPKQTLAFTASVLHAEIMSNIFNRVVPGIAAMVCGKTPESDRTKLNAQFKAGDLPILCNCGTHTEGFDSPSVEIVMMGRPTKSKVLYQQMLGRGTRTLPGVVDGPETAEERKAAISASTKTRLDVIDFVGNAGRHSLVCSADIFSGNMEDIVVQRAKKRAEEKGAGRMDELLEEEAEKLAEEREKARQAEAARKAHLVAKARFSIKTISPFETFNLQPARARGWDDGKQLSPKQESLLLKIGVDPKNMPYAQARQLLNEQFRRWHENLATLKQCQTLKRFYPEINTTNLKMSDASKLIDDLARNGWRRPSKTTPSLAEVLA
jgi:type I site-specific restriction endonuclease